jgi:hypothetical protein
MEYLVLFGNGLKGSFSGILGEGADFFWTKAVPVGLALVWLVCVYGLFSTWILHGREPKERGVFFPRLLFSLFLLTMILGSGAGLEFLLLGEGLIHSQVLGRVLDFVASF